MQGSSPILETIKFPNGNSAKFVKVPPTVDINELICTLKLSAPRALLILNGGTADINDRIKEQLKILFDDLAHFIVKEKITIITGGTNFGIFALLGEALQKQGGITAPCIGVTITGHNNLQILEPHHSHFVMVEGEKWGDETAVMYRLVNTLAKNCLSLAILAGGGEVTINEMQQNVIQNREMIFLNGSAGSTDDIITSFLCGNISEERFEKIIRKGRIITLKINQQTKKLTDLIRNRFFDQTPNV